MSETPDRSEELAHRAPHAGHATSPDIDNYLPLDRAFFERHKEELKRNTLLGRALLILAIFGMLAANLYFTRQSTIDVVENINWSRIGQGSMEDDVATQIKSLDNRIRVIEEQNRRLIQAIERSETASIPASTRVKVHKEGSEPFSPPPKGRQ